MNRISPPDAGFRRLAAQFFADGGDGCDSGDQLSPQVGDLTGHAPITPRAQAQVLADALGAPITFHELTRDEAAAAMRAHIPASLVEATLDIAGTPTEQERRVSSDVEHVLGRPASPYAAWALRNLAAFRG